MEQLRMNTQSDQFSQYINRIKRALRLDAGLYEEVEHDEAALFQAVITVILTSIASGIGNIWRDASYGFLGGIATSLTGWLIWSFLTYFIGTKILKGPHTKADYGELLRTLGFASAPGFIRILGIIPIFGPLFFGIASIWILITTVIAVRQSLDISTSRAIAVCFVGWIFYLIISSLLFILSMGRF